MKVIDSELMADVATVEVQMPQMGESVTEGTVLEWHVSEGQEVSEGDTVVEVSTDKIDAEVPAPSSGVITKLLVDVDDVVEVGQALAELDPNGERVLDATAPQAMARTTRRADTPPGLAVGGTGEGDKDIGGGTDPAEHHEDAEKAQEAGAREPGGEGETLVVAMPEMGESVTEGTVLEWHVAEGQEVAEGDTVIEVSTDKIDAEVPAPAAGTITKLLVEPDDVVKVGQPLAEMSAGARAATARLRAAHRRRGPPRTRPAPNAERSSRRAMARGGRASPVARRAAAKAGVDLGSVQGSGPGGKVIKADVLSARQRRRGPPRRLAAGEAKPLRGPAGDAREGDEREPRRCRPRPRSARSRSTRSTPSARRSTRALKDRGMKVSFTHLIAWAIVEAAARVAGHGARLRGARRQAVRGREPAASTSASRSTSSARARAA